MSASSGDGSFRRQGIALALLLCLLVFLPLGRAQAQYILYDGASDKTPDQAMWGWSQFGTGGTVTPPNGTGATTLDTTAGNVIQAGYARFTPVTLNRTEGYTLRFDIQLLAEDHANSDKNGDGLEDRSGISLIALGSDKKGVELSFWRDEIWPQSDNPLFLHDPNAERAFFATTGTGSGNAGLIHYDLRVLGNSYNLFANDSATPILSGALRDYTAFNGLPGPLNPYQQANFLFLGDDTTSARGSFKLSYVSLAVSPAPASLVSLLVIGGTALLLHVRRNRHTR